MIDTLSTFIDLKDSNDYSQVQAQLAPIIQMGQTIGAEDGTATVLTHHSRKSSGEGSDSVLGSRKVAAIVDTLIKLNIAQGDGMRKLSVQSRFGVGERGDHLAITFELPAGEYRLVNDTDFAEDLVADYLGSEPLTIKELREAMGDDAPSDDVLRPLLKAWVTEGKAERVTTSRGNKGATYRRP